MTVEAAAAYDVGEDGVGVDKEGVDLEEVEIDEAIRGQLVDSGE